MRLIDVDEFKEINDNKIKMYRAGGDYTEEAINLAAAVNGMAVRLLEVMPTVDAEPVVHAHWVCHYHDEVQTENWSASDNLAENSCECSNCGTFFSEKILLPKYKYCPSCGAIIDKPREVEV